jgi:UDP-glucuronate 4-epimerase
MYRDWTYIDDIVAGVLSAADRPLGYEVINLGRGKPTLLSDFVRLVETHAGRRSTLIDRPMPAADIEYTYASIERAQKLLDYAPKVTVEQGVEQFWRWYQRAILGRTAS